MDPFYSQENMTMIKAPVVIWLLIKSAK